MSKKSKGIKELLDAIQKWISVNEGAVSFIGSFVSYDIEKMKRNKKDAFYDDIVIGYGDKEGLKAHLGLLKKHLKREKKKFINWKFTRIYNSDKKPDA